MWVCHTTGYRKRWVVGLQTLAHGVKAEPYLPG